MKEVPGHKKREAVEEQRKGVDMNSQDGAAWGAERGAIGRGGARNETAKQSQVVRRPMAQRAWLGRETLPADRHPTLHCSRTAALPKLSGPVLSSRKELLGRADACSLPWPSVWPTTRPPPIHAAKHPPALSSALQRSPSRRPRTMSLRPLRPLSPCPRCALAAPSPGRPTLLVTLGRAMSECLPIIVSFICPK